MNKIKINILYVLISLLISFVWVSSAQAATPSVNSVTPPQSAVLQQQGCGDPNNYQYSVTAPKDIAGGIFVRLPQKLNPSVVSLYLQDALSQKCVLIGSATVNSDTWTSLGNVSMTAGLTSMVINGANIGAEPYAAAVNTLIVPNSDVCVPSKNCTVNYKGFDGYITPKLISGDTDQISISTITPINGSAIKSVNYYSENQFLYKTNTLEPFNNNYLNNGIHSTTIIVNFSNGQKFTIDRKINAGQSWPGVAYIRTLYYKSSNQIKLFMLAGVFLIAGLLIILIARLIHRHTNYVRNHGLGQYHELDIHKDEPSKDVVVKNITD